MRFAVQLDHRPAGEPESGKPLKDRLEAVATSDPLRAALAAEEDGEPMPDPNPHTSLAAAYLRLLALQGHDIQRIARYMLISDAYCRAQISYASLFAELQRSIPSDALPHDQNFLPGPWRPFLPTVMPRPKDTTWRCRYCSMTEPFDLDTMRGMPDIAKV